MKRVISSLSVLAIFVAVSSGYAVPLLNPNNNHYYDVVFDSLNWTEARQQAELLVYDGLQAHLVTITSSEESLWLIDNFGTSLNDKWIGGFQNLSSPSYSEPLGGWEWITGEAFAFTNWSGAQPNNLGGHQNFMHFTRFEHRSGNGMTWEDSETANLPGFVVEYDNIGSTPIPEPTTLCLMGFGILGMLGFGIRQRRKK